MCFDLLTRTLLPYLLRSELAPTTANLDAPLKNCCAESAAVCAEGIRASTLKNTDDEQGTRIFHNLTVTCKIVDRGQNN